MWQNILSYCALPWVRNLVPPRRFGVSKFFDYGTFFDKFPLGNQRFFWSKKTKVMRTKWELVFLTVLFDEHTDNEWNLFSFPDVEEYIFCFPDVDSTFTQVYVTQYSIAKGQTWFCLNFGVFTPLRELPDFMSYILTPNAEAKSLYLTFQCLLWFESPKWSAARSRISNQAGHFTLYYDIDCFLSCFSTRQRKQSTFCRNLETKMAKNLKSTRLQK